MVEMGLGKQSKILSKKQIDTMLRYLWSTRQPLRNGVIFLLSVKSGMRSKEISDVKWSMMISPAGDLGNSIHLTNDVSTGTLGGRVIPIHKELKKLLVQLYEQEQTRKGFDAQTSYVVRTERSLSTSSQSIVNMFQRWYRDLGFVGYSSHSGRRTFITDLSKKVSLVGGSLRDVQILVGHKNLQTTQRYVEVDTDCQRKMVDLI
jgi:integrase/recombinase XerD